MKFHQNEKGEKIAELLPGSEIITSPDDLLDIMADAGYHDANSILVHAKDIHGDFFNLRTGLAGEILQKFSNYRMRLAVVGDFSGFESKSLKDFIRESNRRGTINFVGSLEEALSRLGS